MQRLAPGECWLLPINACAEAATDDGEALPLLYDGAVHYWPTRGDSGAT
jgi:hypothetical protein